MAGIDPAGPVASWSSKGRRGSLPPGLFLFYARFNQAPAIFSHQSADEEVPGGVLHLARGRDWV